VGWQATALQLAARNGERVLQEQIVQPGRLTEVMVAGARANRPPAWCRSRQARGVVPQRLQLQLRGFDLTCQRDPGQGLTRLPQEVVRDRPIAVPWLARQRLALARQVVEVTPLLRFADLLLDGTFPLRQFLSRTAGRGGGQIFRANQLASAWIDSANTSISRLSCASVLMSGGAMTSVLFRRRGSIPFCVQRARIRPVKATALS